MPITWVLFDRYVRDGDSGALSAALLAVEESDRLAFGAELEARIKVERGWWHGRHHRAAGYALAVIACMPSAARAVPLLRHWGMTQWQQISVEHFLAIARARQLSWVGDLGVRLAQRLPDDGVRAGEWRFVAALLEEGRAGPPVTEGFVIGWLAAVHDGPLSLAGSRLRALPYLDLMLPALFDLDGIGDWLNVGGYEDGKWDDTPTLPAAVAGLAADGLIDRAWVLDATVDRLVRGDRPAHLKPFAMLHEALAPSPAELAGHAGSYLGLLAQGPSTIATLAQRALRRTDEAGLLETEQFLEACAAALTRTEKTVIRAQLTWLDKRARRTPDRLGEILEAVAPALGHPTLDIQERALTVIGSHLPTLDGAADGPHEAGQVAAGRVVRERLAEAAGGLTGELAARAAALFTVAPHPAVAEAQFTESETPGAAEAAPGTSAGRPGAAEAAPGTSAGRPDAAAVPGAGVARMAAGVGGPAELAEEVVGLLHDSVAVGWERVMAALVELPVEGLEESLGPVLDRYRSSFTDRWGRVPFLGEAIGARIGRERGHVMRERLLGVVRRSLTDVGGGMDRSLINTPSGILTLRLAELAVQITRAPVPVLLATPTHVNGALDASVLVERLARVEGAGCRPWSLDFQQALLRVSRTAGDDVLARAGALTSAEGRQLAGWLRAGGLPDPVSTRFEQHGTEVKRRVVVNLESARTDDGWILLEDALVTLTRRPRPETYWTSPDEPGVLTMVLPQHREVAAAWALPSVAVLADQDRRDAALLPLLAECSGPIGPAMTLALVYGLGARHPADRVAAVDAFLTLAARPEPFAAALGADLGDLGSDGTVKLSRVVPALADAHRAGASAPVWEALAAALPALLATAPRGLPDLLELATITATAAGARAEIPALSEVAARRGGSRLVREARRLRNTLAVISVSPAC
ncbi:DUF6493 family protein [Actinoplanes sp. NPDC051861]|uniref:DUF7824 domain-containing protein n=1 Tax=Actinoplanes sp. NPDC051861 TaxID=3155170 RepID=UPI003412FAE7